MKRDEMQGLRFFINARPYAFVGRAVKKIVNATDRSFHQPEKKPLDCGGHNPEAKSIRG